jgi:cob(I)alamin adenosyltransferase
MTIRINRVYTKVGDSGTTGLGDGSRITKTDPRLAAYADVDELNSVIGVALAVGSLTEEIHRVLRSVQNDLFDVGADLCTPVVDPANPDQPTYTPLRITNAYLAKIEQWCDDFTERLPKLTSFILPGGTPGAAFLHQARTVCRRAERNGWVLFEADADRMNPDALKYLNRLSDLLFILARVSNPDGDVLWKPGG